MALREGRSHREGRAPGGSLAAAWPLAVSVLGGWLRQQSRRPGAVGGAASVAVVVVNRSASLLSEVTAEVAKATSTEKKSARPPHTGKRRTSRSKASRPGAETTGRSKSAN